MEEDPWPLHRMRKETEEAPGAFFERPAIELARQLLGCVLVHGETAGTIVETEAYLGGDDLAAHASGGITPRTQVLFGPPGRAYVYLIYGMYECLNIVADREGVAGCVLIRALEPIAGLAEMYRRRNWIGPAKGLANGPGKLTRALGITRALYGVRMEGILSVRLWRRQPDFTVETTPRIGISKCADWPLRFVWAGHACLSRQRGTSSARIAE